MSRRRRHLKLNPPPEAGGAPRISAQRTRHSANAVTLMGLAVMAVATFVAYLPAMTGGFIWDDDMYVVDNRTLDAADAMERIWFDVEATPQYYPLVFTTFWIERQLWGTNPLGYHVVNVALQVCVGMLLWRVLLRLSVPGAWLAGAIFALHPVHVESVAWVTERKNVLSGVFYLSAAICYLRFARIGSADRRRASSWAWYAGAMVFFVIALFSKTTTCVWPAAMLLVCGWRRRRVAARDVLALLPMFVVAVAMGVLTTWVEIDRVGAEGVAWNTTFTERALVAGRAVWFYLGKLVWPVDLSFVYHRWDVSEAVWWQYLFPLSAVALVAVLLALRKRLGGGPLTAILYFGGTLLPALGFVNVYMMQYSFVADHLQYLPSMGPIALAAAMMAEFVRGSLFPRREGAPHLRSTGLPERSRRRLALPVSVLVLCVVLTWRQGRVYRDIETIWRDTLAKNPTAWIAHTNLANLLFDRGDLDEAKTHYAEAFRLNDRCVQAIGGLGIIAGRQGRTEEAIAHFERALSIRANATQHRNLGVAYTKLGKLDDARRHYAEAVRLLPDSAAARTQYGAALSSLGRQAEAVEQLQEAVRLSPNYALAHHSLGRALARSGRWDEAIAAFQKALAIDPTLQSARRDLAQLESSPPTLRER